MIVRARALLAASISLALPVSHTSSEISRSYRSTSCRSLHSLWNAINRTTLSASVTIATPARYAQGSMPGPHPFCFAMGGDEVEPTAEAPSSLWVDSRASSPVRQAVGWTAYERRVSDHRRIMPSDKLSAAPNRSPFERRLINVALVHMKPSDVPKSKHPVSERKVLAASRRRRNSTRRRRRRTEESAIWPASSLGDNIVWHPERPRAINVPGTCTKHDPPGVDHHAPPSRLHARLR